MSAGAAEYGDGQKLRPSLRDGSRALWLIGDKAQRWFALFVEVGLIPVKQPPVVFTPATIDGESKTPQGAARPRVCLMAGVVSITFTQISRYLALNIILSDEAKHCDPVERRV